MRVVITLVFVLCLVVVTSVSAQTIVKIQPFMSVISLNPYLSTEVVLKGKLTAEFEGMWRNRSFEYTGGDMILVVFTHLQVSCLE